MTTSKDVPEKLEKKDSQPHNSRGEKEEQTKGQQQVEKSFTPPLPYPQRFNKEVKDQHFHKCLETFRKLEINIPLAEALEQMPLYAKFLKELINKKKSCHENETIMLTEECRALIQKGLSPKLEDPGSFFLPCTIGKLIINKAMCDLGARINLIPSSLVKKLCIEEVKPTQMSLELVDKSVICPRGMIENLLVKVDKFIFPTDFVVLDSDEDEGDSIILGRPFLATARAIIDVEQVELTLRMHNESITLNVFPEIQTIDEKNNYMETNKEDLQWKEGINKTTSSHLPKQETDNTARRKGNETMQVFGSITFSKDIRVLHMVNLLHKERWQGTKFGVHTPK
ncbi:uncharacterized protein LOC107646919 [Arachis ipaensis]|uniref:uncharacterized protein LOC107646919 n=1 Tax=Arachis ipaensis TaxID=130454 RepID=UPI0007AFB20F|nr:uncharacterized protein LOC107646919 [Arachis ipaensis]